MKPRISQVVRNANTTLITKTTGYTRTHIRRILSGQNKASVDSLADIASAMHISIDELYWHIEAVKIERQMLALRDAGKLTKLQALHMGRRKDEDA